MNRIKILRIIARLNIGGPAIHVVLLAEGLDRAKFESILVCGSIDAGEGDMSYYALEKNIKPYFIPELRQRIGFLDDLIAFKKIYEIIKSEQPDIIHTHTAKAGALGRLAGILYNLLNFNKVKTVKLIHTFHGHIFAGYFNKITALLFIGIEKILARFTYKIIAVSETVKRDLLSLHISSSDKIKVIPLGFELDRFLNIPPRDNTDYLNIGIIGRLVPIKNHRLFLDSAAKVIKNNPAAKLNFKIIGDGPLRKSLEEYCCFLGIKPYVHFLGWQKNLAEVYSDLDIVSLTSINEGTPVSLIEAMASARAVVATEAGGVRDLLGSDRKLGIMVTSRDSDSFASAINLLIKDRSLRNNLGIAARNFVKKAFAKERLIKDIENLYQGVI